MDSISTELIPFCKAHKKPRPAGFFMRFQTPVGSLERVSYFTYVQPLRGHQNPTNVNDLITVI